jgi:exosortase/archaeosortase family protein
MDATAPLEAPPQSTASRCATAWPRPLVPLVQLALLVAWIAQYHRALMWIAGSWRDATYDSWGFLPLVLAAGLLARGLPRALAAPRWALLLLFAALNLLDLFAAPLGINGLSALLALGALAAGVGAFWRVRQGLTLTILLLCSLPLVFYLDVVFGHRSQQLATVLAGKLLTLYGLELRVEGTVLAWGEQRFAVDAACSGLRMVYSALLLGALVQPAGWARLAFWPLIVLAVLAANVLRVTTLSLVALHTGADPSDFLHQGIGLVAFALCCAPLLLWALRRQPDEDLR